MSLQQLDFVFSVKAKTSDEELTSLISRLLDAGFACKARQGTAGSTLLFIQLSSQKYTQLVQKDLVDCFETGLLVNDDGSADRPLLIYQYLFERKQSGGIEVTPGKGDWKRVQTVMNISGYLSDASLEASSKQALTSLSLLSPDYKRAYGTGVAMYFAFLKHYILYLIPLSTLGAFAFSKSKTYSMSYTTINMICGVLFLLTWKRKERVLANYWGVQGSHKLEVCKSDIQTSKGASKDNGAAGTVHRSEGIRFMKQWAFIPVALLFVAVLFTVQIICFVLEIFMSEIYDGPLKVFLKLIPTVALAVFVPVLTIVYNQVVNKYLSWEKNLSGYSQTNSFVAKTFILNVLTGYVPLLITAFVYLPFAHLVKGYLPLIEFSIKSNVKESKYMLHYLANVKRQEDFLMNQDRLNSQFFFFIVTNQVIQLVLKYGLPLVLPKVIALVKENVLGKKEDAIIDDAPEEQKWLALVRRSIELPEYNLHDDFRALALQFGYLSMFGPVWPLAPLVCLIFNVINFKLDMWKLASGKFCRAPLPSRRDTIHPWDQVFAVLAWMGSVISPIVTAFYRNGTKPPKTLGQFALDKASVNVPSLVSALLIVFLFEHIFFALYFFGSKASSLLLSNELSFNTLVDRDLQVRKDFGHLVQAKAEVDESNDWKPETVGRVLESVKASGSSNQSEGARLRSRKNRGDRIINVVDSEGKTTEAIIDDNQHIPMEDVKEVEAKLAKNSKKMK